MCLDQEWALVDDFLLKLLQSNEMSDEMMKLKKIAQQWVGKGRN